MRTRVRSFAEDESYSACEEFWRRIAYTTPKGGPFLVGLASPWSRNFAPPSVSGRQVTTDENHRIHNLHDLRGSVGDLGGEFDSWKAGRRFDKRPSTLATGWGQEDFSGTYDKRYFYKGPVLAINPGTLTVDFSGSLRRNLKPVGTTAIARCKPTNHVSNLATDLFELYRDGLPRLPGVHTWQNKTRVAKSIGNEYLNSEFGWKPLVDDIRNASYAAANSHRLMKTYEENSGKKVRRAYAFPVEETVTAVDLGPNDGYTVYSNSWSGGYIDGTMSQPHLIKRTTFRRETWFSGCFTYYLPFVYKSRSRIAKIAAAAGHLYGIELTPDVVWKASPWTWAIDWFSNMGDVVSNVSDWATDGLVMHYGYLMEHIVSETTYALDRPARFRTPGGSHINASPVTVYYESKQRVRATPFGFETSWNGLSPRQLAIAAALGITRIFS